MSRNNAHQNQSVNWQWQNVQLFMPGNPKTSSVVNWDSSNLTMKSYKTSLPRIPNFSLKMFLVGEYYSTTDP